MIFLIGFNIHSHAEGTWVDALGPDRFYSLALTLFIGKDCLASALRSKEIGWSYIHRIPSLFA